MGITKEFREAVATGNKTLVRIILTDIMIVDPTMEQFDERLAFAKSNMSDLFDEHDGEVLKYDNKDWNESYLDDQKVVVVSNFSKERVELLRNMVRYIYRDKVKMIEDSKQSKNTTTITRKQVGIGMTATGAVATAAGIFAHQGMLIAGGVVVAAVGVGLIVTDKEA